MKATMDAMGLPEPEFKVNRSVGTHVTVILRNQIRQRRVWFDSDLADRVGAAIVGSLTALERLSSELLAEGKTPLAIGIGLHVGEAIVGHLGSKARHDYSAIGDTTNVASRIEGLTKELGYPIVCSQAVISELAQPDGFVDLGLQAIKGHSPVHVWGWRAP